MRSGRGPTTHGIAANFEIDLATPNVYVGAPSASGGIQALEAIPISAAFGSPTNPLKATILPQPAANGGINAALSGIATSTVNTLGLSCGVSLTTSLSTQSGQPVTGPPTDGYAEVEATHIPIPPLHPSAGCPAAIDLDLQYVAGARLGHGLRQPDHPLLLRLRAERQVHRPPLHPVPVAMSGRRLTRTAVTAMAALLVVAEFPVAGGRLPTGVASAQTTSLACPSEQYPPQQYFNPTPNQPTPPSSYHGPTYTGPRPYGIPIVAHLYNGQIEAHSTAAGGLPLDVKVGPINGEACGLAALPSLVGTITSNDIHIDGPVPVGVFIGGLDIAGVYAQVSGTTIATL